jgi:hypothetical protein
MGLQARSGASRTFVFAIMLSGLVGSSTGYAQDAAADFYKSRSVTLGVPNSAGGGYDVYARALARHLGKHIPGRPTIVVQDVPAAGGMVLANQLYSSAPRDGSYIGMIRGTVVQEQVYKSPQVQFDARKFAWIGNMNSDYDACVVSAASPVKTVEDFYKYETAVGASGAGAQSFTFPLAYRDLLGMKFKVIAGYPGTPERIWRSNAASWMGSAAFRFRPSAPSSPIRRQAARSGSSPRPARARTRVIPTCRIFWIRRRRLSCVRRWNSSSSRLRSVARWRPRLTRRVTVWKFSETPRCRRCAIRNSSRM